MTPLTQPSPSTTLQLASYADLPLPAGREAAVASILAAWLPDANALSKKMSAAVHQDLLPATMFVHPVAYDDEVA